MFKSMSMHKRDSKKITKFDFVTSCFTFKGSIITRTPFQQLDKSSPQLEGSVL